MNGQDAKHLGRFYLTFFLGYAMLVNWKNWYLLEVNK